MALYEISETWARGGLNPGPCAYQAHALTRLSHGPSKKDDLNTGTSVYEFFGSHLIGSQRNFPSSTTSTSLPL